MVELLYYTPSAEVSRFELKVSLRSSLQLRSRECHFGLRVSYITTVPSVRLACVP